MNWARIYLFNVIAMPVMGIFIAVDSYRDGRALSAVCGTLIVLLSPVWFIYWRKAKKKP